MLHNSTHKLRLVLNWFVVTEYIALAARFLTHLRSPTWREVDVALYDELRGTSVSPSPLKQPRLSKEDIPHWKPIDDALAHPDYTNVTVIHVELEHYHYHPLQVFPAGYDCIDQLLGELLPRQRERLKAMCNHTDPNVRWVCICHR